MSVSANRRPDGPPGSAARRRRRAQVIVALVAVAVAASALVGWRFARESTPVSGPILLISLDPLRADGLSFYGGTSRTPHLERLAAGATVFTRAYAHAAASLPAHASLLTGQLPFDHGVRDNIGFTLAANTRTLAARLSDRGFETAAAVSTFLLRRETGLDAGFAHYDDAERASSGPDAIAPPVERDSPATARAAVEWLDAQDSARFFYALQLVVAPAAVMPVANASTPSAPEQVEAADAAIGAVLDALRRKGWYDDALVIVTSTYGGPPDGADDPGRGFTLDAPVMQVPLVVKMPGAAEARRVDAPLQHIDLVPTLLDLVRAPGASNLRGRSFRGVLEASGGSPAEAPPYAEAMAGALRFGWAEIAEPAGTFRSSPGAVVPETATDAEREALALLGEVAPTLVPTANPAQFDRRDPRAMGHALALYRRAARLDAGREFAAAVAAYRQVVEVLAGDANAWYRLGLNAARLGRTQEALAAFERVTAIRPGHGEGTLAGARVEVDAARFDAAETRLTTALEASPALPAAARASAHGMLAAVAASRKRPAEARAQAAQAEQAAGDVPYVAFLEGRLLHDSDDNAAALEAFDQVVATLGDRPSPFDGLSWYRGDSLARLDRHPEAVEAFERAIAEAPFDLRAYTSLATLQHAMNRDEAAVATVERLVRAVPTPAGYATAVRLFALIGERSRSVELRAESRVRFAGESATPRRSR